MRVDQQGIDVTLKLLTPNDENLFEEDTLNSTQGPELIAIIAKLAGEYRLEIAAPDKSVPPGQYAVRTETIREATEQDYRWITAQGAYGDGIQLRAKTTAESQRASLQKFEEAFQEWKALGDRLMMAHSLYYIATGQRRLGQPQKSVELYEQALQLVRELNEQREEVSTLNSLSNILGEIGEARKSLPYYERALTIWRTFKDTYGEARTLNGLGVAYALLGEPQKALVYYRQSLAVWQTLGNRQQTANTLNNMGGSYDILGKLQDALEHYNQALSLYKAMDNRRGEAQLLNNIGAIYGRLGEPERELEHYRQALTLWRVMGDRRNEANTLANIGVTYTVRSDVTRAMDYYQQALKIWREVRDPRGEAITLWQMGDLQVTTRQMKEASVSYEQSLSLLRTVGDRWREAVLLNSLGALQLDSGDLAKADDWYTQSLALFRTIGDRRSEAKPLYGLARLERRRGNLNEALNRIEEAITRAETVRADVGSQQLRASYMATVQSFFELQIDVLMRLHRAQPNSGFDALALNAGERARARGLMEILVETNVDIRQGVDANLIERERELTQVLNAKASRLTQRNTAAQLEALKKEISQLETEYEQVKATIRKASPRYAAITQPQPLGLTEIQQQVLDQDSLLLEYSLGEERSYLWAVTADSMASYELPKGEIIQKAAQRVTELLTARSARPRLETPQQRAQRIAEADATLPEAAKQLSEMILAPAADRLADRRLLIVPDGALQYIPFAMLPDPATLRRGDGGMGRQGEASVIALLPLVLNHELVTLPSASTLAVMRKELAGRQPAPKMLAVFADPVFAGDDERNKSTTAKRKSGPKSNAESKPETLAATADGRDIVHEEKPATSGAVSSGKLLIPRLPFTRQEAERILAVTPNTANLKAIDFRANRSLATSAELSQYKYLHFATHGLLDTEREGLSALVLSLVDEQGKPQDGFLRAHELYNLNLPAELVVLSACQTGLGKEYKGEGLVGLTRGFMYAGAARVMVSLWNVNDRATAELMPRFYQKMLKEGQSPAAALRNAQVEMWRQKQWAAPYYWAAFVLQGEWK